jgi:hypothetical protein
LGGRVGIGDEKMEITDVSFEICAFVDQWTGGYIVLEENDICIIVVCNVSLNVVEGFFDGRVLEIVETV